MPIRGTILILSSLLSLRCGLELSDHKFYAGFGAVTGVVEVDGEPVGGAQVGWVGAAFGTPPAETKGDGRFLLQGVPSGEREIIIRAEPEARGLRAWVRVVAGRTSGLGRLALGEAPPLKILVKDPDLGIFGARVHLQEIAKLEAQTDDNGIAFLPVVPRSGCYTPTARVDLYPFVFPAEKRCPGEAQWDAGLTLLPDEDGIDVQAQVHHAYKKLLEPQLMLAACDSLCLVPDWWAPIAGPPCPWPIGATQAPDSDLEKTWRYVAETMASMKRFNEHVWINIQCPTPGALPAACSGGSCTLLSSEGLLAATRVASGRSVSEYAGPSLFVPETPTDLEYLAGSLSLAPLDPPGPDSLYVFLKMANAPLEPPNLVVVLLEDTRCLLFFEAGLYPTTEQSPVPPDDSSFSLYRLDFAPGKAPVPGGVEAHLSWITPLP